MVRLVCAVQSRFSIEPRISRLHPFGSLEKRRIPSLYRRIRFSQNILLLVGSLTILESTTQNTVGCPLISATSSSQTSNEELQAFLCGTVIWRLARGVGWCSRNSVSAGDDLLRAFVGSVRALVLRNNEVLLVHSLIANLERGWSLRAGRNGGRQLRARWPGTGWRVAYGCCRLHPQAPRRTAPRLGTPGTRFYRPALCGRSAAV